MAGHAQPPAAAAAVATSTATASTVPPSLSTHLNPSHNNNYRSPTPTKRRLPEGPCNFRNLDVGAKAPSCGCRRFWENDDDDNDSNGVGAGSVGDNRRGRRVHSQWCICGHLACYHDHVETRQSSGASARAGRLSTVASPIELLPPVGGYQRYSQQVAVDNGNAILHQVAPGNKLHVSSRPPSRLAQSRDESRPNLLSNPLQAHQTAPAIQHTNSTSDLPRIPSECLLSSGDLRFVQELNQKNPRTSSADGLGLEFNSPKGHEGHCTPPTTLRDEYLIPSLDHAGMDSGRQSTRPNSVEGGTHHPSLNRLFRDYMQAGSYISTAATDVPYTPSLPILQSPTEVATPSNANTPDLGALDQDILNVRSLIGGLNAENLHSGKRSVKTGSFRENDFPAGRRLGQLLLTDAAHTGSGPSTTLPLFGSMTNAQLQKLVPYLNSLHHIISGIPNLSNSLGGMTARLDALETRSLSHGVPDEVDDKLQVMDARMLEMEEWKTDHDKLHVAIDADHSSRDNAPAKPKYQANANTLENASFTSNLSFQSGASLQSATSSALIVAAIDRNEVNAIKERLDDLEAAMPSSVNPWHVEVVFLPWGRDLKGVWFSPDRSLSKGAATTQDTEEWTEAPAVKSSSPSTISNLDGGHSGWSSQAIHRWADTTDEWLSPKACGSKNLAYRRLKSRGFVRDVTLNSSNAGDIQASIYAVFGDLVNHMASMSGFSPSCPDLLDQDQAVTSFPGLGARFLPLRKTYGSSQLRFVSRSELATSALWTSHFLASGVMMRLSGGHRRLYITHREAYLQRSGHTSFEWSWPILRELPRMGSSLENQKEQPSHVAEADAKEACWENHPSLDLPSTAASSFSVADSRHSFSHVLAEEKISSSGDISFRLASDNHSGHSQQETSQVQVNHRPISPLSEFPTRPMTKIRTSLHSTDEGFFVTAPQQNIHQVKRRVASFDGPSRTSRSDSTSKSKRRRLTRSPDGQANIRAWGFTPRRSKEPQSPFFSEARIPSDSRSENTAVSVATGGPGIMRKGGNTPSAYATPHSGTASIFHIDLIESGAGDTQPDGDCESWNGMGEEDTAGGYPNPNAAGDTLGALLSDDEVGDEDMDDVYFDDGDLEDSDDGSEEKEVGEEAEGEYSGVY